MKKATDTKLFTLIHDYFKVYLPNQRKYSPHTIRAYQGVLESLLDFVKNTKQIKLSKVTFEMIDSKILTSFLDWIEHERGCAVSTRNHRLQCIRSFYSYAVEMKPMVVVYQEEILKVPMAKAAKSRIVEYMSETAVKTILEQPDTKTTKGLRDQFMMVFLYDTASRIEETLDVRLRDIRLGKEPAVTIVDGKGSKSRIVPLSEKAVEHYRRYREVFHPGESEYSGQHLFYTVRSGSKKRMCEDNARRFIRAYGTAAKSICSEVPDNVHPHLFRHSRSMHLYQHGMDLTLLSQWLGHAQLETTLIYAYADTEQKRKAIESATDKNSPLGEHLDAERYIVDDDEILKRLYGLK